MGQRILVVGSGGIGGLLAARLASNGELDVTVAVRRPTQDLRLTDGGVESLAAVRIIERPEDLGAVDWVVVATKAGDVPGVAHWLTAPACRGARVGVAQNGIEQVDRVAAFVDASLAFPMIVTYGAERAAPGRIVQTLDGVVRVPGDESGSSFAELAEGSSLAVERVEDIVTALWVKLAWNLASNSLTTLADVPVREVPRRPGLRLVAEGLVAECVQVGRRVGADLDPMMFEPMMEGLAAMSENVHSSMWQDRRAGRPLEHDAISGAVVRAAERVGLDVPHCRTVTALLDALSQTAYSKPPNAARG